MHRLPAFGQIPDAVDQRVFHRLVHSNIHQPAHLVHIGIIPIGRCEVRQIQHPFQPRHPGPRRGVIPHGVENIRVLHLQHLLEKDRARPGVPQLGRLLFDVIQ